MEDTLLNELAKNEGKRQFTVLSSHYPLICSQVDTHCRDTLLKLSTTFEKIAALKEVDLYLGAHMHQYERVAPYNGSDFASNSLGPYYKGQMASVVEAVAGNDLGIIDQDYPV